mgnify:CR=1 FL=1
MNPSTMKPGVYAGISDNEYHGAHWALSSSGARYMLKAPAVYLERMSRPRTSRTFDVGKAVHAKVLGVGAEVVSVPDDLLDKAGRVSTNAAKAWKAEREAEGSVVLPKSDLEPIRMMAEAVLGHQVARRLVEKPGIAEASVFAIDPETGEWVRARPDYLPDADGGRTVLVDLKSALDASPYGFMRACGRFGYFIQDAHYLEAVTLARGDDDPAMVFVAVEKEPPYLVSVTELGPRSIAAGRDRRREAINLWHECRVRDEWPGYPLEIVPIDIPEHLMTDDEIEVA